MYSRKNHLASPEIKSDTPARGAIIYSPNNTHEYIRIREKGQAREKGEEKRKEKNIGEGDSERLKIAFVRGNGARIRKLAQKPRRREIPIFTIFAEKNGRERERAREPSDDKGNR